MEIKMEALDPVQAKELPSNFLEHRLDEPIPLFSVIAN